MTTAASGRLGVTRASILAGLCVGMGGAAFVWWIWSSGGEFWRQQEPRLPFATATAAIMVAAVALAVAIPSRLPRSIFAVAALGSGVASFMGGDLLERDRFQSLLPMLEQQVATLRAGGICSMPCVVDSKVPLRVAFRFDGDEDHWNGACYDESDLIGYVDEGYSVHRPVGSIRPLVDSAMAAFGRHVHHTLHWGDHWYGCSTRP